jgi:GTP-binding protein
MSNKIFQQAVFVKSAPKIKHLPQDSGFEVAFLGRSNAGKSSAINAIVQQKGLAKTSKTPGRTAALNIFKLDQERRLVDVPGFGFAKVSVATKAEWVDVINEYLATRECLKGVILVMDIRHPFKPQDCQLIEWLQSAKLPYHIILTKADKLNFSEKKKAKSVVENKLPGASYSLFSAKSKLGLAELHAILAEWYNLNCN